MSTSPQAQPSRTAPLTPGTMLQEYRIDAVLGAGAFGVTYRATDTYLDMIVALKEFFPEHVASRKPDGSVQLVDEQHQDFYHWSLQRFIGEAQVLAQFKHPNIVRVARYFNANATAYIVMEFERGDDFGTYLDSSRETPDEDQLLRIFLPILDGLQEVHRKRYLHRDIKPGNIFLRENGQAILLDFGAAELEMAATNTGRTAILTPGYAPIEQYAARAKQGPYTDLYALGATLYRAITGITPAPSTRRLSALKIKHPDPLRPAREAAAGRYSDSLLKAVDHMLCVLPNYRPQSAHEVMAPLQQIHRRSATRARQSRARINHKLIFTGPVGAGKTTAIASLSDTEVVATDAQPSASAKPRKRSTTVAMDYGVMSVSADERVHLYGTPGQQRFDFMWEILSKGAVGVAILIDNSRRNPFQDLDFFLNAFRDLLGRTRFAIGITRSDSHPRPGIADYHAHLQQRRPEGLSGNPPIFTVDAREAHDVACLVQAILYSIDPGVDDYQV